MTDNERHRQNLRHHTERTNFLLGSLEKKLIDLARDVRAIREHGNQVDAYHKLLGLDLGPQPDTTDDDEF